MVTKRILRDWRLEPGRLIRHADRPRTARRCPTQRSEWYPLSQRTRALRCVLRTFELLIRLRRKNRQDRHSRRFRHLPKSFCKHPSQTGRRFGTEAAVPRLLPPALVILSINMTCLLDWLYQFASLISIFRHFFNSQLCKIDSHFKAVQNLLHFLLDSLDLQWGFLHIFTMPLTADHFQMLRCCSKHTLLILDKNI